MVLPLTHFPFLVCLPQVYYIEYVCVRYSCVCLISSSSVALFDIFAAITF